MKQVQISALVSEETRKFLDAYAREHGVKKGFIIESAILHHLDVLQKLPQDVVIPPRIVVTRESGEEIIESLKSKAGPTKAMSELFDD